MLIVHHTGKNAERGGRGSSALRAALDAEFMITGSSRSIIHLKNTKQKDAAEADTINLKLTGESSSGSCVITQTASQHLGTNDNQQAVGRAESRKREILNLLIAASEPMNRQELIQATIEAGIVGKSQASAYITRLVNEGRVFQHEDGAIGIVENPGAVNGIDPGA